MIAEEVLIGLAGGSDILEARGKTEGPAPFPEKETVPPFYDHPIIRATFREVTRETYTTTIVMRWHDPTSVSFP